MSLANASLSTSDTDVFTCSNAGGSAITSIVFFNSDTVTHNVNLHACPAGEAHVVENQLIKVAIPAGESYTPDLGKLILADTDVLTALNDEANTTTAVGCTVSYLDL